MCLFKKKKLYRIKYTDLNGEVRYELIEATSDVKACRIMEKRNPYPWQVRQILCIKEVE